MSMGDKESAYVGPYRATKVWNDVIAAFRQYLPCGRHRRYMKTFDNCFSGSAAIEWLLQYLKTNDSFQSDISRGKAASLVNKLYHAGIFEEVQVTKSMRHKAEVQENRLYRFLPISPSKIKISRLPLAPRNDSGLFHSFANSKNKEFNDNVPKKVEKDEVEKKPQSRLSRKISILKKEKAKKETDPEVKGNIETMTYPPCHIITRILTTKEIKDTWKAIFNLRLRKVLGVGVSQLSDIVQGDLIDGYNVMHNCIYLNKSGVVTNIDDSEQLPHWVMSAMKCLAHWPEPREPGLPNYPGFEKDVFRVIRDYFMALEEPLVPYHLYETFTTVFVMCGHQQPPQVSPYREQDSDEFTVPSSLWTSASLENIILNLTKKYCTLDSTSHHYGTHEDLPSLGGPQDRAKLFASQEDLRFSSQLANHLNEYNRSVFPSTDGMDKLSNHTKSLNRFASQESCPSLPGLVKDRDFLSKSTQSCGHNRHPRNQRGFGRKYGSTPNLKVSKYETAFGPDNRTVTRVFYQNGLTTDVSHDDDENDDVFLSTGPENLMLSNENHLAADHTYVNDRELNIYQQDSKRSMMRSSSAIGVHCTQSILPMPIVHEPCKYENRQSCPDYSNVVRSTCNNPTTPGKMNISIGQTIRLPVSTEPPVHDSSHASIHSAPEINVTPGSRLRLSARYPRQLDAESHGHANVTPQPSHAVKSIVTSPAVFYSTMEKMTPVHQRSESCLLKEMYGPGYRPSNRSLARSRSQIQSLGASRISTSSLQSIVSGNIGRCGRDEILPFDEQGYRPVLDASKERKMFSSSTSSLLERVRPPGDAGRQECDVQLNNSSERLTSTPMFASFNNVNIPYLSGDGCPPSRIPSRVSTHRRNLDTAHSGRFMSYPQTRLSEDRARNSLQLVALLLPPANRRKLHLLFKLMVKMTSNPNLCLDPTQTTRSLVLSTFYKSILRSPKDEDEMVVLQLVSFMLDFYAEILSPPENIKTQVSDRLKVLQNPQVVYSPRPDRAVRFCQQVSTAEFENQRHSNTQMSALEELLEGLIKDENMTVKEKRRKLKQFQRTYPAIYTRRFPNPESEATVLPLSKPKIKQPFAVKPLHKFKGLRL